jgi:hypothetical protein
MRWEAWLLAVPVSGLITGGGLRALGVPRGQALWAGIGAGAFTFVVLVVLGFELFAECLAENRAPAPPLSWPWSPRRELCNDGSSPAALGALALLLIPTVLAFVGTLLRSRGRSALGWTLSAVVLATPLLPPLYVGALPYYALKSYPVLHEPLLRPARESRPPRVCYVYGIAHGSRTVEVDPDTERHCVDLERTPEALSLTSRYDEGRTIYDLDWMGKMLTEEGLPVRPGDTGVDGLLVERAYKLPDREARIGATVVD